MVQLMQTVYFGSNNSKKFAKIVLPQGVTRRTSKKGTVYLKTNTAVLKSVWFVQR